MKIFTKSYLLLIALMLSFFSGMSTAADIEAGVVKRVVKPNLNKKHPLNNNLFDTSSLFDMTSKEDETVVSKAAASGISHFEIVGVISAQSSGIWDNIQYWQTTTNDNHGGSYLYVAVLQIGYGNANPANMNAISKTAALTQLLCGNDLHVCNSGETVVGWLYYYDYSGQSAGYFTSSSNSTASPYGYWSDSIYIQ